MKTIARTFLLWITLLSSASVYAEELQEAKQQYYFGFGPGFFSHMNSDSLAMVLTPGVMWSIDPQFDLAITSDIAFSLHDSDARMITPQLKGRYLFDQSGMDLYAGGGLGYGYAHVNDENSVRDASASGFAVSAAFGIKAYRGSTVQISAEIEHSMILSDSSYGNPHMTFLKVGVHFF